MSKGLEPGLIFNKTFFSGERLTVGRRPRAFLFPPSRPEAHFFERPM